MTLAWKDRSVSAATVRSTPSMAIDWPRARSDMTASAPTVISPGPTARTMPISSMMPVNIQDLSVALGGRDYFHCHRCS